MGEEGEDDGGAGGVGAGDEGGDRVGAISAEGHGATRPVRWLFSRLSHMARRATDSTGKGAGEAGPARRSCVFKFFAAMAVKVPRRRRPGAARTSRRDRCP